MADPTDVYPRMFFPCPFCADGVRDGEPCDACQGTGQRQPKIAPPTYGCEDCRDTGWVTRLGEGAGVSSRCACKDPAQNPQALRDRLVMSGMGDTEIAAVFEPWETKARVRIGKKGSDEAWEEFEIPRPVFTRDWLDWTLTRGACPASCCDDLGEPRNPGLLVLLGSPGRGKTMQAAKLLALFIKRGGQRPVWARVPTIVKRVMSERRADGPDSMTAAAALNAGLLVLDDLGYRVEADPEGIKAEMVADWIDERQRFRRPTICTSNAQTLGEFHNPRLESRLASGLCRVVGGKVDFRDIRR